jgi:hypothetical protein
MSDHENVWIVRCTVCGANDVQPTEEAGDAWLNIHELFWPH